MVSVPFSGVDNLMRALDEPRRPQTIEIELALAHRLDERRFRQAVTTAADRHPMARARQLPPKPLDLNYVWKIDRALRIDPVEIAGASGAADIDQARNAFSSRHIDIAAGPPFRVMLAHERRGDRVMMSVNHSAFDGVAALRLLQSVSRAYAGEGDPLPAVDPLATTGMLDESSRRLGPGGGRTALNIPPRPARLASTASERSAAFGILHLDLPVAEAAPPGGATVNDVLMAALHSSVDRWNRSHAVPCHQVSVMMPVNQRPAPWRGEVVANLVLPARIVSTSAERATPARLLAAVAAQTKRVKAEGVSGTMELARTGRAPVVLRRLLPQVLDLAADRGADTTVLSNLGRVDDPPWFGGEGRGFWFSPPPRAPVILALGAVTADERLGISLRWCTAALSRASAYAFADLFRESLAAIAAAVPTPPHA